MRRKYTIGICLILLLTAFLRFYALDKGNPLSDEADYGFRSYGLLDYEYSKDHTTPLEWYDPDPLPFWLRLSFNDAPPLFFLIQHFSFVLFGDTTFALRFPSAVFGTATVALTILLGSLLYGRLAGAIAGLLLAISTNAVFVSRTGMIDATVIFFIVLTILCYRKSFQDRRYLYAMGVALGLGMLTKYTAIIALLIITFDVLFSHTYLLRVKELWISLVIAACLFLPVIFYNVYLFRTFGHFDFSLMNMLGPIPDVWQQNPGRDIGSVMERIARFIPSMFSYGFWGIILLTYSGILLMFLRLLKQGKASLGKYRFLLIALILIVPFVVMLGPAPRFLAIMKPFFVLFGGFILAYFYRDTNTRSVAILVLCLVFVCGVLYDVNTFLIPTPVGASGITYSKVYSRIKSVGYVNLEKYFADELKHSMPKVVNKPKYSFIHKIQSEQLEEYDSLGYTPLPAVFILDPNLEPPAAMYVFGKLNVYHGWPNISIRRYLSAHNRKLIKPGTILYYVALDTDSYVPIKGWSTFSQLGPNFEKSLQLLNIPPTVITDWAGNVAFRVYKWKDSQYTISIH